MSRRVLALAAIFASGCATYGFADRAASTSVQRPVAVRTLDIDADAGANVSTLTQELVRELRRAGVPNTEWTGANRPSDVITCRVSLTRDVGYGTEAFVEVSTRCAVDGSEAAHETSDAQLRLSTTDRSVGRRRAAEAATRASLGPVARQLATYLQTNVREP